MRAAALLLGLALLLAGCGGSDPDDEETDVSDLTMAQATDVVHEAVDGLVQRTGRQVEVRRDEATSCQLSGDTESESFTYIVLVAPSGDAKARVVDEVVPELTADGWELRSAPDDPDARLSRDGYTVGWTFGTTNVTVRGFSPCVPVGG